MSIQYKRTYKSMYIFAYEVDVKSDLTGKSVREKRTSLFDTEDFEEAKKMAEEIKAIAIKSGAKYVKGDRIAPYRYKEMIQEEISDD